MRLRFSAAEQVTPLVLFSRIWGGVAGSPRKMIAPAVVSRFFRSLFGMFVLFPFPPSRTPSPPHLCGFSRAPLPSAPLPFGWGRATWSCLWWAASRVPSVGQSPAWCRKAVQQVGPGPRGPSDGARMGAGGGRSGFGVAGFLGH